MKCFALVLASVLVTGAAALPDVGKAQSVSLSSAGQDQGPVKSAGGGMPVQPGSEVSRIGGGGNEYCVPDSAAEQTYVRIRRAVVDPKEASDSYGRRLGRRFVVFEITVENNNPSFQYILHDVSVDLSCLQPPEPTKSLSSRTVVTCPSGHASNDPKWVFSGQDLIMLRGVPEKGSDYDPRNLFLHVAQGTGAVAGGVTGLTTAGIQDLYGGTTAAFNGPVLSAFGNLLFPDHTATQLNRLSDSAFTANTVVAKQSAKTFAIFVPEGPLMTRSEQRKYWKEPVSLFNEEPNLDFRGAEVCVDGAFISEIPATTLLSVSYDDPKNVQTGQEAAITLQGTNLSSTDTIVDVFGSTFPVSDTDAGGKTGHAKVKVSADWTKDKAVPVSVESKSTGQKTPPVSLTLTVPGAAPPTPAPANGSH